MDCLHCNNPIPKARRSQAKYCSRLCRQKEQRKKWRKLNKSIGLSTGKVGALGELRVSVDLMLKKYEVFRALSPACSCDLVALKDNKLLRIEVRTANFSSAGKIVTSSKEHRADVLALVLPDEKIIYTPQI